MLFEDIVVILRGNFYKSCENIPKNVTYLFVFYRSCEADNVKSKTI